MNEIENKVIRYQIDFEKYKNGQANEVIEMLDTAVKEISKFIKKTDGVYTKKRYKEISEKLKDISKTLKENIGNKIDIDGVIDYELAKQKKILSLASKGTNLKGEFTYPTREQIKTTALFRPIDTKYGMTYQSYLESIESGLYNTWDAAVRTGYLTGQSTRQIVSDVVGGLTPQTKIVKQGAIQGLRNSVYANTRTVIQSFANGTMERIYEENEDLLGDKDTDKFEYLATLDSRTCLVCGSLDGKLFKSIKDCPHLPQHRGCRCMIIPYFEIEGDKRATKEGYKDKVTFNEWLKKQDDKTQLEVLGATRYKMYKDGVKIEQFVDNGRLLTIDELKESLEE